jgi:surface antigen
LTLSVAVAILFASLVPLLGASKEKKILKNISGKGIKLSLIAKKKKVVGRAKTIGLKTKVGVGNLNIDEKLVATKEGSKNFGRNFYAEIKTIFFKPVRQTSHIGLALVILIVLATGIPAPKVASEAKKVSVDPFGERAITSGAVAGGDKVSAVEAVATVVSVIDTSPDNKLANEAYEAADAQSAKTSLAVSGDAIAKLAMATTISSGKKATFTKYVVQTGDTLSGIAIKFGITTDSIKWSNGMSDADSIKPGQSLNIPSISGILYTVKSGDSIEGIASRYKSSAAMIIAQNDLQGDALVAGMQIIVPDGVIEDAPVPAAPAPRTQVASGSRGSVPSYVATSAGPNRFPYGYCTWWVAHKRYIPWNGNAWQWYGNAIAYGRAVGKTPVPGAVMVTWESSVGHVAYVESVSGGSFTVSEMNYRGWGISSTRTITTSSVPLIGFIY